MRLYGSQAAWQQPEVEMPKRRPRRRVSGTHVARASDTRHARNVEDVHFLFHGVGLEAASYALRSGESRDAHVPHLPNPFIELLAL